MSKELPYFKFIATEWITGDIGYEDYAIQGMFIKLCSEYWNRGCDMTTEESIKRVKGLELSKLENFIILNDGNITIKFLDEQWKELMIDHKRNVSSGKKGAEKRWGNSPPSSPPIKGSNSTPEALRKEEDKKEKRKEKEKPLTNKLQIFIKENCKRVSSLKDQLTLAEAERLEQAYPTELLRDTLMAMENKKGLTSKYESVNLTLLNWLKNDR